MSLLILLSNLVTMSKQSTVFMAMSGGVDSSVAAALLKKEGYNVVGVFMKNWSDEDPDVGYCTTEADFADMRAVCQHLDIPYYTFNFESEYRDRVIKYFFDEYQAGRTPNPDVMCNKEIKFGLFFERARAMGADFIATGHYAQKITAKTSGNIIYRLGTAKDKIKDQTYFLYNLTQDQLASTIFPIGKYKKSEIRRLAAKFKLPTAQKKDSYGICFIGPINVSEFLKTVITPKKGKIINTQGEVMGTHEGAWFYTIGQRRVEGLSGTPEPMYVVATDTKENTVTVGNDRDTYGAAVLLSDLHLINPQDSPISPLMAKSRYTPDFSAGSLERQGKGWLFTFKDPERALTPGQSLVIYKDNVCLGGGIIESVLK